MMIRMIHLVIYTLFYHYNTTYIYKTTHRHKICKYKNILYSRGISNAVWYRICKRIISCCGRERRKILFILNERAHAVIKNGSGASFLHIFHFISFSFYLNIFLRDTHFQQHMILAIISKPIRLLSAGIQTAIHLVSLPLVFFDLFLSSRRKREHFECQVELIFLE